jgi:hypothetical protein
MRMNKRQAVQSVGTSFILATVLLDDVPAAKTQSDMVYPADATATCGTTASPTLSQ